jgi:tetratricopeptide (TPR) repeat protein
MCCSMRWIFIFLLGGISFTLVGQSANIADELFNKKDYLQAGQIYQELLKRRPNDALYNYRYARCSYELRDYPTAIEHFLKSGTRYPLRDYYLADSYFHEYNFSEAIRYFNSYAESSRVNLAFMSDVDDKLRRSAIGLRLLNRVEVIQITDSIVVNKTEFLNFYEISKETGSLQQNAFYKDGDGWLDLIRFITQRGDRMIFSDTTYHSIDLFTSNRLLDGWSSPERLSGQVNTEIANENYPFLMLDGLTLFYASDGEGSIGGYDIFMTRFSGVSNDYLNPENIGMPFNSLWNDYMLVIDEMNEAGWFVSDRYQPRNKVAIYRFIYTGEKEFLPYDNTPEFIDAATLRQFEWVEHSNKVRRRTTEVLVDEIRSDFLFYVTDHHSYTRADQFQSTAAQTLFVEWNRQLDELRRMEEQLKELREAYGLASEDLERASFVREMLAMEREVLRLKRQLDEKEKNIRNEEIKFLKKSDVL